MKTVSKASLPPCPCDDPKTSKPWQRYYCRKKGCTKPLETQGRPADKTKTLAQKRKEWNLTARKKLREAREASSVGGSTVATVVSRATPGKPSKKTPQMKKGVDTGQKKMSTEQRKFDALYRKNPLVFTYLKNPDLQKDPHGLQAKLHQVCHHCAALEESGRIPPYGHAPWCHYFGLEELKKGGPNDGYSPEDFVQKPLC